MTTSTEGSTSVDITFPRRGRQHYPHNLTARLRGGYVHVSVTAPNGARGTLLLTADDARRVATDLLALAAELAFQQAQASPDRPTDGPTL